MNVVKCQNGHFYDADTYDVCPHCGAEQMQSVQTPEKKEKKGFFHRHKEKKPAVQPAPVQSASVQPVRPEPQEKPQQSAEPWDSLPPADAQLSVSRKRKENHTKNWYSMATSGVSDAPITASSVQVPSGSPSPDPAHSDHAAPAAEPAQTSAAPTTLQTMVQQATASQEGKTLGYFKTMTGETASEQQPIDPVVGWLVCMSGPHMGAAFCLHAGKNTLGRNPENDVVLDRDMQVSRVHHATVIYEPKKRDFYLQPGDSSGLTYYNGEYIAGVQKMEARATLEVGESQLLFVPFCGPDFSWEEKLKKE